jgi:DNA-binding NarL/FixJ family response regulator
MRKPMLSVCLCDPQPIVQQGLKAILDTGDDLELVGSAPTLEEATAQIERLRPAVVIVDRGFGMHPLLEWITKTRQRHADTEVVVWAAAISDVECFRALQAGARGIMKKTVSVAALHHCLRTVARKELWTENLFLSKDQPLGRPRNRPLTPREQQVAALVAKGMKNREIAEALEIATGTVKIHLMHIFEKTGIRDRFELALHGLRLATARDGEEAEVLDPEAQDTFASVD